MTGGITCLSQIPFTIDGCDNMGFAFGAVSEDIDSRNISGRCFLLAFLPYGPWINIYQIKNLFLWQPIMELLIVLFFS